MAICGVELDPATATALGGIALAIASELIAASPLRENGVVQLALTLVRRFVPVPTADSPRQSESRPPKSSRAPRRSATRRRSSKSSSSSSQQEASE